MVYIFLVSVLINFKRVTSRKVYIVLRNKFFMEKNKLENLTLKQVKQLFLSMGRNEDSLPFTKVIARLQDYNRKKLDCFKEKYGFELKQTYELDSLGVYSLSLTFGHSSPLDLDIDDRESKSIKNLPEIFWDKTCFSLPVARVIAVNGFRYDLIED